MKAYIFVINTSDYDFDDNPREWTDDKFKSETKDSGGIYTLEDFQEAFNDEEINSNIDIIRVLWE